MTIEYGAPVNVSPLIKFSRWTLLGAGILYGIFWNNRYAKYEASMKPIWDKEKAERDAFIKEERTRKSAQDIADLEKLGRGE